MELPNLVKFPPSLIGEGDLADMLNMAAGTPAAVLLRWACIAAAVRCG